MTVISKTIRDYEVAHAKGGLTTDTVGILCPFSIRAKPKHVGDYQLNNQYSAVVVPLRLVDNFVKGIC